MTDECECPDDIKDCDCDPKKLKEEYEIGNSVSRIFMSMIGGLFFVTAYTINAILIDILNDYITDIMIINLVAAGIYIGIATIVLLILFKSKSRMIDIKRIAEKNKINL